MKSHRLFLVCSAFTLLAAHPAAFGYGQEGHQIVGEIAQQYLAGTNAGQHVQALLGTDTLAHAATWADRIRGGRVDADARTFLAAGTGNTTTHAGRHYCDVPIQVGVYRPGGFGTNGNDVVQSIGQCIRILQNPNAPKPAGWTDKIALMLLAHYMGDLHQPLHVGAVYIANDAFINPVGANVSFEETHGGNWLTYPVRPSAHGASTGSQDNMHYFWDTTAVLHAMGKTSPVQYAGILKQNARPTMSWRAGGAPQGWAQKWANETLKLSKAAYAGVQIANRHVVSDKPSPSHPHPTAHPEWDVTTIRADYDAFAVKAVNTELTRAGYRLAEVLKAIWP